MTLIRLTHANHKQPIYIVKELIGGWYHSPGNVCTHIVLNGGAVFPALESVDEVTKRISGQSAHESAPTMDAKPMPKTGSKKGK